jgi:hypothetical protein
VAPNLAKSTLESGETINLRKVAAAFLRLINGVWFDVESAVHLEPFAYATSLHRNPRVPVMKQISSLRPPSTP